MHICPVDEGGAPAYMHHGVPSYHGLISKALVKLVSKYSENADWLDWCKIETPCQENGPEPVRSEAGMCTSTHVGSEWPNDEGMTR